MEVAQCKPSLLLNAQRGAKAVGSVQSIQDLSDLFAEEDGVRRCLQVILGKREQSRKDGCGARGSGAIKTIHDGAVGLSSVVVVDLQCLQYGQQSPVTIGGIGGISIERHGKLPSFGFFAFSALKVKDEQRGPRPRHVAFRANAANSGCKKPI